MNPKISNGIEIKVETHYQPDFSNPANSEFMFAYKITIENNNIFTVKLLSRYWKIFDSNGTYREVEGEGVVGVQPVIMPGEKYQYISGCNFKTEFGKMSGKYLIENLNNNHLFEVDVPTFIFQTPFKLN